MCMSHGRDNSLERIFHHQCTLYQFYGFSHISYGSEGGSATLYFIAKAQGELADNNLDRATRYLNQLTGKPRTLIQVGSCVGLFARIVPLSEIVIPTGAYSNSKLPVFYKVYFKYKFEFGI